MIGTFIGSIGPLSIGIAMLVLARLSQRLGRVTNARPYFVLYYLAIALVWIGVAGRIGWFWQTMPGPANDNASAGSLLYTIVTVGLPALGITLGLGVTWYYWSWLLAERD